jgi:hypothetical protein
MLLDVFTHVAHSTGDITHPSIAFNRWTWYAEKDTNGTSLLIIRGCGYRNNLIRKEKNMLYNRIIRRVQEPIHCKWVYLKLQKRLGTTR